MLKIKQSKATILKRRIKKYFRRIRFTRPKLLPILAVAAVSLLAVISIAVWYKVSLRPVGSDISILTKIKIEEGSSLRDIADYLDEQGVIRNSTAFYIYVRMTGSASSLQAGTYRVSPAETIPQIAGHLINGSVDQFSITFYPGSTLVDNTDNENKYDVTTILRNAGFSDDEISEALSKDYNSPLFTNKPSGTSLEGYIYGETYNFNEGVTVEEILQRTFDEFYEQIEEYDLIDNFAEHGLNLYEGITLASIIQREVYDEDDQKQVAQVFYSRLEQDMILGSDVTYQYIADKLGLERDPDLNSPYNTRRYGGLPPGPISAPGLSALLATVNPASGDYLYFLSGDDDVTYFARTYVEHEANIINHCQVKCSTP